MGKFGKVLSAVLFIAAFSFSSASAQSQRQIKFIVPFPAGGGADPAAIPVTPCPADARKPATRCPWCPPIRPRDPFALRRL